MLRLFRDYMAHKGLWLAPVDTFIDSAHWGLIIVTNSSQFENFIKIPTLCVEEDANIFDVMQDMKASFKILEFYVYTGQGLEFFADCEVVDDTFFLFNNKWYFIPFCLYESDKVIPDVTEYFDREEEHEHRPD